MPVTGDACPASHYIIIMIILNHCDCDVTGDTFCRRNEFVCGNYGKMRECGGEEEEF